MEESLSIFVPSHSTYVISFKPSSIFLFARTKVKDSNQDIIPEFDNILP